MRVSRPLQMLADLTKQGRTFAIQNKFDERSFWEQKVVWADMDVLAQVDSYYKLESTNEDL